MLPPLQPQMALRTACADRSWSQSSPHLNFGKKYLSWFPSSWSRQVLGGTINLAYVQHLYTSIRKDYTPGPSRQKKDFTSLPTRHWTFLTIRSPSLIL